MFLILFETKQTFKKVFYPGNLGLKFADLTTGEILKVDRESQAGKMGIKKHWTILSVNGNTFNYEDLKNKVFGEEKFEIKFRKSNFIFK